MRFAVQEAIGCERRLQPDKLVLARYELRELFSDIQAPPRVSFESVECANKRVVVNKVYGLRTPLSCNVQSRAIARPDIQEALPAKINRERVQKGWEVVSTDRFPYLVSLEGRLIDLFH